MIRVTRKALEDAVEHINVLSPMKYTLGRDTSMYRLYRLNKQGETSSTAFSGTGKDMQIYLQGSTELAENFH